MARQVIGIDDPDGQRLISRVREVSGITLKPPLEVLTDTSDYTRIQRGQILRLGDRDFMVGGAVYEPRFGMKEELKFWVKQGYDLLSGQKVILKFEFHEEFITEIGELSIPCYRSPEKEGEVMWLVRGDSRFMQGETFLDDSGNHVRVIQFINGNTLYGHIYEMEITHETYYHTLLAPILRKVIGCCEAIQMLHNHNLYHGDIRSDHIIIDESNLEYRWIDFDLCQDFPGFDLWRLGNVVQFVVGKGLNPFYQIRRSGEFPQSVLSTLESSDAGAFYSYRLMNLKKIYPHISDKLNDILLRFSAGAAENYASVLALTADLNEAVDELTAI